MTARSTRTCACGCGASLEGMRSDAKYLSPDHKAAGHRRIAADLPPTYDPDRFWRRTFAIQRRRPAVRAA